MISPGVPWGPGCPEQTRALSQCLLCPGLSLVSLWALWTVIGHLKWWLTGHPGHGADTCQCSGRDCESISQWPAPAPVHRTGHPQVRQHHPQPRDCHHQHHKCLRKHQVLLSIVSTSSIAYLIALKCPTVLRRDTCFENKSLSLSHSWPLGSQETWKSDCESDKVLRREGG